MIKYSIILKESDKSTETYRIKKEMFLSIKEQIMPFRTYAELSKPVKCIETGIVFKNAKQAAKWLYATGITSSTSANAAIKLVCKGKQNIAYGYHWKFIKSNI